MRRLARLLLPRPTPRGGPNKEISSELPIREKAVHHLVSGIFAQCGVGNRTEAARLASSDGLG